MSSSKNDSQDNQSSTNTSPGSVTLITTTALVAVLAAIALAFFSPARNLLSKAITTNTKSLTRTMSTSTTTSSPPAKPLNVIKRPWNARGHADHGWLYSYHTFSFASYHDNNYVSFGPLRVINEDRVERGTGFGTHAHREALIWSYIVSGELEHKDSMGNLEKLRRGEVQFTSAGTGIRHSEYNRNTDEDVHFLQIWATPDQRGLTPSYKTRKFDDADKRDTLLRIMESNKRVVDANATSGPIPLQADISMDASILSPGSKVTHRLVEDGARNVYFHVVMSGRKQPATGGAQIKVGKETLGEGDGAFVRVPAGTGEIEVESVGAKPAEFLLFDMGQL